MVKLSLNKKSKMDDILLNAANALDGGELTKAGRALQKHGERLNSLFPKPQGNPHTINEQAPSNR